MKIKNMEGFDRILQKVLKDGCDHLISPFTVLFNKIYSQKLIPDQMASEQNNSCIQKGDKSKIENNQSISNFVFIK
jgi:hypothetical protein